MLDGHASHNSLKAIYIVCKDSQHNYDQISTSHHTPLATTWQVSLAPKTHPGVRFGITLLPKRTLWDII